MSELCICSFNLRIRLERDGINFFDNRRGRIHEALTAMQPDLIGFQEVNDAMRSWLEEELFGLGYALVGCGREADCTGEATPVAYRRDAFSLIAMENRWLSAEPLVPGSSFGGDQSKHPRIFTACRFLPKGGAPFLFLNTHLDHIGENAKLLGAMEIQQYLSMARLPFIVTGDLNSQPGSAAAEAFTAYRPCGRPVLDATAGLGPTYHRFGQLPKDEWRKIDYIFTDMACDPARSLRFPDEAPGGVYISDHFPVCAWVEAP